MKTVYHPGEEAIQQITGESLQAGKNGKMVSDSIVKGAVNFIEKQPMVILSSTDEKKQPWPSLLTGDYGFVTVSSPTSLSFDRTKINSTQQDIFFSNTSKNHSIGTLFIELHTRRRFRINGTISMENERMELAVVEAYPNCPKYIQQRMITQSERSQPSMAQFQNGNVLTEELSQRIAMADTLFVASQSAQGLMDVSHRGGPPGFIEIIDDTTLKIPDYQGNSMYNTWGNFYQNPRAGLLLIDFTKKETWQFTGAVQMLFNQTSTSDFKKTTGTGRYWLFKLSEWIHTANHHHVDWEFLGYSPFNP